PRLEQAGPDGPGGIPPSPGRTDGPGRPCRSAEPSVRRGLTTTGNCSVPREPGRRGDLTAASGRGNPAPPGGRNDANGHQHGEGIMKTQRIASVLLLAHLWALMVFLGGILFVTTVLYPNIFYDIPGSLVTTMEFAAVRRPSDFFAPVGLIAAI